VTCVLLDNCCAAQILSQMWSQFVLLRCNTLCFFFFLCHICDTITLDCVFSPPLTTTREAFWGVGMEESTHSVQLSSTRQIEPAKQCRFETLRVYNDARAVNRCECFTCRQWIHSTYSLGYFVRHGLKLSVSPVKFPLVVKIDVDLIAQLFQILEERTTAVREEPPRLLNWAAYRVWLENSHCLDQLPLPNLLRSGLKDFSLVEPITEFRQSREIGMSVMKPWALPRSLMKHLESYIRVEGYPPLSTSHDNNDDK